MNDPYDIPTCSTCGDVAMYCKCIEKLLDRLKLYAKMINLNQDWDEIHSDLLNVINE